MGHRMPEQGWKIHVSATQAGARSALRIVSGYCHDHGLAFKHLRSLSDLFAANAKEADRSHSGKFITVYPCTVSRFRAALESLGEALGEFEGPEVLTDLQWRATPVYVRYGAFVMLRTEDRSALPALRNPGGALEADSRAPRFAPPDWLELPPFLREQLDTDAGPPPGFPFVIASALKHSNAGGVYLADTARGHRVVLKHARPHAGLTPDGRDAVARLLDEGRALDALSGSGVEEVHGTWELDGHHFLATEYIAGTQLATALSLRCPLLRAGSTPEEYREYRDWALTVLAHIAKIVDRIHAAGWVYGDLHPRNVILLDGGEGAPDRPILVDFELAHPVEASRAVTLGAPGFRPPDDAATTTHHGFGGDLYALAALNLYLFLPLPALIELDPLKAEELIAEAQEIYDLDEEWVAAVSSGLGLLGGTGRPSAGAAFSDMAGVAAGQPVRRGVGSARRADAVITGWNANEVDGILSAQVMIARALDAAAEFDRSDRLWPGDPRQFAEGGFGLAHGAAGVIHAQLVSGCEVSPLSIDWLTDTAERLLASDDEHPIGLYDGTAGLAWVLRRLGAHQLAGRLSERVRRRLSSGLDRLPGDLYNGLAGIGLFLLSEAEVPGNPAAAASLSLAASIAEELDDTTRSVDRSAGLMWGLSGEALFLLHLSTATGRAGLLDDAERRLEGDLAACVVTRDGSLQLADRNRVLPYLAHGSAGIGLVAAEFAAVTASEARFEARIASIARAASAPFCIEPGLFRGRVGLMHALDAFDRLGFDSPEQSRALAAHADALSLHALRYGPGILFPGQWLVRLSCDLATGAAGVLVALQQRYDARSETGGHTEPLVPFLTPPTRPTFTTSR